LISIELAPFRKKKKKMRERERKSTEEVELMEAEREKNSRMSCCIRQLLKQCKKANSDPSHLGNHLTDFDKT